MTRVLSRTRRRRLSRRRRSRHAWWRCRVRASARCGPRGRGRPSGGTRLGLRAHARLACGRRSLRADAVLVFDAADVGEPNLGYILENRLLQYALLASLHRRRRTARARRGDGCRGAPAGVVLRTAHGELQRSLAGGRRRRALGGARGRGPAARGSDYRQIAIVANVATERGACTTPPGSASCTDGTLALLPLADGTSSIVWSADEARARTLLAAPSAEAFEAQLMRARTARSGDTHLVSERRSLSPAAPERATLRHRARGAARRCGARGAPARRPGCEPGLLDAAALAQLLLAGAARPEKIPGRCACCAPMSAGARARSRSWHAPSTPSTGCSRMAPVRWRVWRRRASGGESQPGAAALLHPARARA